MRNKDVVVVVVVVVVVAIPDSFSWCREILSAMV